MRMDIDVKRRGFTPFVPADVTIKRLHNRTNMPVAGDTSSMHRFHKGHNPREESYPMGFSRKARERKGLLLHLGLLYRILVISKDVAHQPGPDRICSRDALALRPWQDPWIVALAHSK